MRRPIAISVLLAVLALAACGGDDECACGAGEGASTSALSFTGKLASAPSEPSQVLVLWSVSSGSPDYLYKWGSAAVHGSSINFALRSRPPADALNDYGLGVGLLLLAPSRVDVPEGKLTEGDNALLGRLTGADDRHAIIYVDHDRANAVLEAEPPDAGGAGRDHWLFDFPDGYACGEGRDAPSDETFDYYVPVDCSAVEIKIGDPESFEFPNWT
jgi:hypothetical protein